MGYPNIDVYYYNSSVSVPKEFADGNYHKDGYSLMRKAM